MGISTTVNRVGYSGNGTSATYAFPYEFHSLTDLDVYVWNSARVIAGILQVFNTNYTVNATPDAQGRYINGGNVIFNSTPAIGDMIVILRDMTVNNPFRLGYNQQLSSQELGKQMDRLTMIEQRLADLTSRSIRLNDSFPLAFSPALPDRLPAGHTIVVGSGGLTFETVMLGSSLATFVGTLAISGGGTGSTLAPLQGSIPYASSLTEYTYLPIGGPDQLLVPNGLVPGWGTANLASNSSVTGILAQANGGTGSASSFPLSGVLIQKGAQTVGFVPSEADGRVLTCHGSSAPSFDAANITPVTGSSVIASVTLGNNIHNQTILANSSGYNIRLMDAVGNGGKRVMVSKTSATTLGAATVIIASGAQTIGSFGNSVNMWTQNELWELESDNANWLVKNHYAKSERASFGVVPITTIGASPNPVKGTVLVDRLLAGRDGSYAEGVYEYAANATGSSGTGNYLFDFSALGKIDTQKLTINNNDEGAAGSAQEPGTNAGFCAGGTTAAYLFGQMTVYNSTLVRVQGFSHNDVVGCVAGDFFGLVGPGVRYQFSFRLPMFTWQP